MPTPSTRRLREARQRGLAPFSPTLCFAAALVATTLSLLLRTDACTRFADATRDFILHRHDADALVGAALNLALPSLLCALGAALLAGLAQRRGLRRWQSLARLGRAAVAAESLALAALFTLGATIALLMLDPTPPRPSTLDETFPRWAMALLGPLALVAGLELGLAWLHVRRQLRPTPAELQREARDERGAVPQHELASRFRHPDPAPAAPVSPGPAAESGKSDSTPPAPRAHERPFNRR